MDSLLTITLFAISETLPDVSPSNNDTIVSPAAIGATSDDVTVTPSASAPIATDESQPTSKNGQCGKVPITRRPANPCPSGPTDYYREWAKGNCVLNLVKHKLGASTEAKRLKHQKAQEDERCALLLVRRMNGDDRDEYFDALGISNSVYGKLRAGSRAQVDADMDELL